MPAGGNDNGCAIKVGEIGAHLARQGERGATSCGAYKVDVGSANPPDMTKPDYNHSKEPMPVASRDTPGV